MTEHQKDLFLLALPPTMSILLGLSLAWLALAENVIMFLQQLTPQLILIGFIFTLIGYVGCGYEVRVLSKYVEILESNPAGKWPVNRRLAVKIFTAGYFVWGLYFLIEYGASSFSKKVILGHAVFLILTGFGFAIVFGMMFLCVTIMQRRKI